MLAKAANLEAGSISLIELETKFFATKWMDRWIAAFHASGAEQFGDAWRALAYVEVRTTTFASPCGLECSTCNCWCDNPENIYLLHCSTLPVSGTIDLDTSTRSKENLRGISTLLEPSQP